MFKFLWLEFRFKSFLELHVHFKGFVCIRMRKMHAERQIPDDAQIKWCCHLMSQHSFQNIERQIHYRNFLG